MSNKILYEKALQEYLNNRDDDLWLKSVVECFGDEEKAEFYYIKLRVEELENKFCEITTKKFSDVFLDFYRNKKLNIVWCFIVNKIDKLIKYILNIEYLQFKMVALVNFSFMFLALCWFITEYWNELPVIWDELIEYFSK